VPYLEENSIFQSHNEAVVSVSSDGNILYIFRDGKLFEVNVNEKIKDPTKLNKNVNIARFQNHAAISPDGTIIYFTSKPKINEGGTDIFMATKNSSGNWSTPERLDMTINTDYDEDSPFLDSDGTLYFSSNGLPGYGGFDVYKTHKEDGKWTTPENLGQPINSAGDDLYFTLAPNSSEGFYSSARPSGNGDIDIYQVYYNVNRSENKLETPIAISSPIIDTIELNDAPYAIIVLPETVNGTPLEIQSVELAKTAEWQPHSLYFDFDKYELSDLYCAVLNDIIYELKRNNNLAFNINGYADSRGSTPYNKSLSLKRAMFVKRYMLDNGIKSNRIIALNAFGESAPENNCTDGVVCNESEYLLNRKVSMVIQKSNKIPKPLFTVAHRID
jgi:outer membrane protein OmpA-like peptidoglycan-associated protein